MTVHSETAARRAADTKSPAAMNRLGCLLKVKGRHEEAAQWFRRSAEAGNADAMANLATYLMGEGRNREAAEWFRRAGGPLGEAFAEALLEQGDGGPDAAENHRAR
ncbi:tetratricopeptide repeat protein [Nocardia sp. NPDC019395]|uniref:tetratricopeptide repeat protein n=1 Tax=Nocardia sp. NPDC019395 TaxID=3154686 RepID=UPI00340C3B66